MRSTIVVKYTLFGAYYQSIYACALWSNFTLRLYGALRVQYDNTFRALLRLDRFCNASGMFADAAVDDFFDIMCTLIAQRVWRSITEIIKLVAGRIDATVIRRFTEFHVLRVRQKAAWTAGFILFCYNCNWQGSNLCNDCTNTNIVIKCVVLLINVYV